MLALAVDSVSGILYLGTADDGLWLTADHGVTWSSALPGRPVYAVATAANGQVYAAAEDGLYHSVDHGASWRLLPFPSVHGRVVALALASDPPRRLYAAPEGRPIQWSSDGGARWKSLPEMPPGATVTALAPDPRSPGQLYVGTSQGLWRLRRPGLARTAR